LRGNNRPNNQPTTNTAPPVEEGPEEVSEGDVIRVNTTLVTIPVSVMDRDGRYIPNLQKEDFRLWEDEVEQQVAYFQSVDKPFSLVLMIDTSGSTRFRLDEIQDSAITFVNQLRPEDRVMVVSFDDSVRVLSEFTSDRNQLRHAIRQTNTGEGTRLYDAVDAVINQRLNRIQGRKAIVLFTDGVDTTSRRSSYEENVRDAEELDALVYPIQYDTYSDVAGGGGGSWPGANIPTSPVGILAQILGGMGRRRGGIRGGGRGSGTSRSDYELANQYLRDLAEKTGARQYRADTTQNLALAFSNIAEELRRQYSIGYYPKRSAQPGERRQIRVRVNQPNLAVRTRDSYVFNPQGVNQEAASQQPPPVLRRKFSQ
jgi:VWFA-related protein